MVEERAIRYSEHTERCIATRSFLREDGRSRSVSLCVDKVFLFSPFPYCSRGLFNSFRLPCSCSFVVLSLPLLFPKILHIQYGTSLISVCTHDTVFASAEQNVSCSCVLFEPDNLSWCWSCTASYVLLRCGWHFLHIEACT